MTRARSLKQTIRTRAAKTGERYTTARRHVLKALAAAKDSTVSSGPERVRAAPAGVKTDRAATAPVTASKIVPATVQGAVSDARVREKTGHSLDHWFARLDAFGGAAMGHTALARHLSEAHAVPGWYAQGITVSYERARGVRTVNQRVSGAFEVSVTKTVEGDTREVARAFGAATRRAEWLREADAGLAGALSDALSARPEAFVIREDGLGRFRYRWGTTTVQCYLLPKGPGRTAVNVTQMKLASAEAVEAHRTCWRTALAALARHLSR
jgi:hypothetical protein